MAAHLNFYYWAKKLSDKRFPESDWNYFLAGDSISLIGLFF